MSSNDKPIPIPIANHNRRRSVSVSSTSSASTSSSSDPTTPVSPSQRINIPLPSTSPILSYFLAQSPKSPATTAFPFKRKFGSAPMFEDEEPAKEIPVATHARRASTTVANRFSQSPTSVFPDPERGTNKGANVLRRLSLSMPFATKPFDTCTQAASSPSLPPNPPPNTAVSPTHKTAPFTNKPHRSATISTGEKPRRAPSPMGERILKGHFDGFN